MTTPPSQSIPSRNRSDYFGHVYPRERNKRYICISCPSYALAKEYLLGVLVPLAKRVVESPSATGCSDASQMDTPVRILAPAMPA